MRTGKVKYGDDIENHTRVSIRKGKNCSGGEKETSDRIKTRKNPRGAQ